MRTSPQKTRTHVLFFISVEILLRSIGFQRYLAYYISREEEIMYQLIAASGEITNSEGKKFDVIYKLIKGELSVIGEFDLGKGDFELLEVTKVEQIREDSSYKFTEYGAIFGMIASFGQLLIGTYHELADIVLGFAIDIIIYAVIGMIIGIFIKREVPHYTFNIKCKKDESIWTVRCHKVLFDIFEKFSSGYIPSTMKVPVTLSETRDQSQIPPVEEKVDLASKLEKYFELYQKGVISEDDYNQIKKKIIDKEATK